MAHTAAGYVRRVICPHSTALALALLSGSLVLSGCGSDAEPAATPTSAAPEVSAAPVPTPAAPTAVPTPEPTGTRTVASLEAQVRFSSVALSKPIEQQAVAAYKKFVTDFVVLGGLPDASYAPVLAALRPDFRTRALKGAREVIASNRVVLGPYTEKVVEVAGDERGMYIGTCIDYSKRSLFEKTTGKRDRGLNPDVVPILITMVKPTGSSTWQVASSDRSKDITCAP